MPSSTFLNLPPAKQEKILAAARAEFSRVPYAEASINQIIRGAEIPRGSFYMYFLDKSALFSYLITDYVQRTESLMRQLLAAQNGDLLAAFLAFFDYVQAAYHDPHHAEDYEVMFHIMRQNSSLVASTILAQGTPTLLANLAPDIDRTRLDLHSDTDLETMLGLLVGVVGHAIRESVLSGDHAGVRAKYVTILGILARGMVRTP